MKEHENKKEKLLWIIEQLREKCPWDKKQTHQTLTRYLQEEAYEVIEAIYSKDSERLKEELGDLLFQVLIHARIAEEQGKYDFEDILDVISGKMVSRHPHVFGKEVNNAKSEEALKEIWNRIKADERKNKEPVLLEKIAGQSGPTQIQKAIFMQNYASRKGFDWRDPEEIIEKIQEELNELKESLRSGKREDIRNELGDMILAITNFCRFMQIDFERSFEEALLKFGKRFDKLLKQVEKKGRSMEDYSIDVLEEIWQKVKKE